MTDPNIVARLRNCAAQFEFIDAHNGNILTIAADEIELLNNECTRLACRNAVLVLEADRIRAGNVRLRKDVESAVRIALYEGEE